MALQRRGPALNSGYEPLSLVETEDPRPRAARHHRRPAGDDQSQRLHRRQVERGFQLAKKSKHLLLAIESPGGSAAQSDLIGQFIRRKAAESGVNVTAVIGDVGASGGYWLACAADKIYANRLSIVGSIGVITGGFGLDKFIARHGIERRLFTAGENKARMEMLLAAAPRGRGIHPRPPGRGPWHVQSLGARTARRAAHGG